MDGFALGRVRAVLRVLAVRPPRRPQLLPLGRTVRPGRPLLRLGRGALLPQPPVLHRRADAGGAINNPENIGTKRLNDGRIFKSWGCDAYGEDVFVFVENEDGTLERHSTCFDLETVGHQLSRRDIDWAYYSADPYQAGYIWQAYSSIRDIFHDEQLWDEHIWPVDDLMRDIEAGSLPPVTWITPRFQLSDHPPFSTKHAHNWVTEVVNGIMRSDMWDDVAIFVTWDEWGGLYDHVAPAARSTRCRWGSAYRSW